ncbi:MAG: PilN domain-containing protein [Gemmatimonadales bacterium]|nr:PilN domain-containing protein [Gemmatimonadales bacterium]
MITINLRPGQKRKRAGSPLDGLNERLKAAGARIKDPMLIAAVVAWILVGSWIAWSWTSNARELHALEPRLSQAQVEHKRFASFISQKRHQELIRDSLLAQIGVIRTVDGDRYIWPHVLDEVARALPAYTWLVELTPDGALMAADSADTTTKALSFKVTGRTVDIQAYTRFLRQLEASPWIQNVTPVSAQTVVEHERPVTAFTIKATFRKADSAYIRTVPLSQSVR